MIKLRRIIYLIFACQFSMAPVLASQEGDLAKQLANPIASLISVPIEFDYDSDLGPDEDGERMTLVIKPVAPFSLNEEWNLITRTIIPFIDIEDIAPGVDDESGLGDIQASFFFSPKATSEKGWIWGVGPIALLPTASEDALGSEAWGLGPTAVALKQEGQWTYGMLANHVWTVDVEDDREDYTHSFVQPFLTYTMPSAMSVSLQTESKYDWESEEWTVPINLMVQQVTKVGSQLVQFRVGVRYWADSPYDVGPEGWGLKAGVTLLFPK